MIRRLYVASVFLVVMAVLALPVGAGIRFCAADPIFVVGGELVDVLVEIAAPPELLARITEIDPVKVLLLSPEGTDPWVKEIYGDFTEVAYCREHDRGDFVAVAVKVPERVARHPQYLLRVTVRREGYSDPVAQIETDGAVARLRFDW